MGEQPPSTCHSNGFGGGENGRSDNFSHFSLAVSERKRNFAEVKENNRYGSNIKSELHSR